jgi:hypothetical protein
MARGGGDEASSAATGRRSFSLRDMFDGHGQHIDSTNVREGSISFGTEVAISSGQARRGREDHDLGVARHNDSTSLLSRSAPRQVYAGWLTKLLHRLDFQSRARTDSIGYQHDLSANALLQHGNMRR